MDTFARALKILYVFDKFVSHLIFLFEPFSDIYVKMHRQSALC